MQLLTRETRLLEPEVEAERLAQAEGEGGGWAGAWRESDLGGASYSCRRQTTEEVSDRRLPPLQPADLELDPEMGGSFQELLRTRSMSDEVHQGIDGRSRGDGGEMEELMRPPLVNANGRPVSSAGGGGAGGGGAGGMAFAAGGMTPGERKGGDVGLRLDLRLVGGCEHGLGANSLGAAGAMGHGLPPTDDHLPAEMMSLTRAHAGGPGEPEDTSPGGDDWFATYTPSGAAAETGAGAAPCLSPLLSPGTLVDAF